MENEKLTVKLEKAFQNAETAFLRPEVPPLESFVGARGE
jgi:hypothetical protein